VTLSQTLEVSVIFTILIAIITTMKTKSDNMLNDISTTQLESLLSIAAAIVAWSSQNATKRDGARLEIAVKADTFGWSGSKSGQNGRNLGYVYNMDAGKS